MLLPVARSHDCLACLTSDSESSAPIPQVFLGFAQFRKGNSKGKENHQLSFRARSVFPSHAFASIIQNRILSSNFSSYQKNGFPCPICQKFCASSFQSTVRPRAFPSLECVIFAVWRACAIEPDRLLDTIALVLSWRCVVQAILQDYVRQLNVAARCGCTALHRRDNVSFDSAREVAQEHVANIELRCVTIAFVALEVRALGDFGNGQSQSCHWNLNQTLTRERFLDIEQPEVLKGEILRIA